MVRCTAAPPWRGGLEWRLVVPLVDPPPVAFGIGYSKWSMWTLHQPPAPLRAAVALVGVRAEDNAPHFLRIGSAIRLSAGEATPEVWRREGRWASDT